MSNADKALVTTMPNRPESREYLELKHSQTKEENNLTFRFTRTHDTVYDVRMQISYGFATEMKIDCVLLPPHIYHMNDEWASVCQITERRYHVVHTWSRMYELVGEYTIHVVVHVTIFQLQRNG